jgi:hypothetical protein
LHLDYRTTIQDSALHAQNDFAKRLKEMEALSIVSSTFLWFTESPEYSTWLNSGSSQLLWHPSAPGSGKTILVQYLLGSLCRRWKTQIVSWFFCKEPFTSSDRHHSQEQFQSTAILQSIICQLIHESHVETDFIEALRFESPEGNRIMGYQNGIAVLMDPTTEQSRLWELLRHVLHAIPRKDIVIVIDAVDCLSEKSRAYPNGTPRVSDQTEFLLELKKLWNELQEHGDKAGPIVRILLTSLPFQDIYAALVDVPTIDQDTERRRK